MSLNVIRNVGRGFIRVYCRRLFRKKGTPRTVLGGILSRTQSGNTDSLTVLIVGRIVPMVTSTDF